MVIRLTGKASRQDNGMLLRVRHELNAEPDGVWLDAFRHLAEVKITGYPRDMFEFSGASVTCPYNEMRAAELLETLTMYLEDANVQSERLARRQGNIRLERERSDAKRRQTSMIVNELFDEDEEHSRE